MKSACVGVLSIIELKNARWNIEIITRGARNPGSIFFTWYFKYFPTKPQVVEHKPMQKVSKLKYCGSCNSSDILVQT